jgi:peptidoglycan/LPS O-acetylase OafA/YrhL
VTPEGTTPGRDAYETHIDGLRAIAVLAVILYHLWAPALPGGFAGVDVFFVISGYVVSRAAARDPTARARDRLAGFYARRAVRILPALVACLVVTMLASALIIPPAWLSDANEKTGLRAFFGLSNLTLARSGGDYFAPRAAFNPFTHTWSLGVEEQFYLMFPWLFAVWRGPRRGVAAGLFAIGFAASLLTAWRLAGVDQDAAFYALASRFWELAAGVLLMQAMAIWPAFAGDRGWGARWRPPGAMAGLVALGLGLGLARPQSTPFPDGLLPCAGTLCLLACLHDTRYGGPASRLLNQPALRAIGLRAYSLYLWHWPVFVLFRWTVGLDAAAPALAALAVAVAVAAASYRWIETPPRRLRARLALPPSLVLPAGAALVLAGFGLASWTLSARHAISLCTVTRHAADWYQDRAAAAAPPGCALREDHGPFGAGDLVTYDRIMCPTGAHGGGRVLVVGDSHAGAYLGLLRGFVLRTGRPVTVYTMGGCGLLAVPGPPSAGCVAFKAAAAEAVARRVAPGDIVFLPALRLPRIANEFALYGVAAVEAQLADPDTIRQRQRDAAATAPVLARWTGRGATVLFEAPTPVLPSPAFRCADWYDRMNPICAGGQTIARPTIERWRRPVLDEFAAFRRGDARIRVWDALPLLCPGRDCSAYRDGKPLFFDGDHLSSFGNRFLLDDFTRTIEAITPATGVPG